MTALAVLVGLGLPALVCAALWRWLAGTRIADATVPDPLPDGFRLELLPRDPADRSGHHVAVVVPAHVQPEQVLLEGDAGRWRGKRRSHPRERRIYASAPQADVAARFAIRWFHGYHARLDEAEAAMAAWNGPEGPLPAGTLMVVEVGPKAPTSERARFVAHLMVDHRVPAAQRDGTLGTGVTGLALGTPGAWPTAAGDTADAAASAVHRALLRWHQDVRAAHLTAAGWA